MSERSESGQAQILATLSFGIVMVAAAILSLRHAQQTRGSQVQSGIRSEIRTALDEAIKRAAYIYRAEAGCDPVSLDLKLSRIRPDGSMGDAASLRRVELTVNSRRYPVAFGPVARLPWTGDGSPAADPSVSAAAGVLSYVRGQSQDALIEVWTSFGNQRVTQMAALINDCTLPCGETNPNSATNSDYCPKRMDRAIAYHTQGEAGSFSGSLPPQLCYGGRMLGDLKYAGADALDGCPNPTPNSRVSIQDVILLRNYLRSGDAAGSCHPVLVGDAASRGCADLNSDGLVNESDLHILEKFMRGYLYWIPTNP